MRRVCVKDAECGGLYGAGERELIVPDIGGIGYHAVACIRQVAEIHPGIIGAGDNAGDGEVTGKSIG